MTVDIVDLQQPGKAREMNLDVGANCGTETDVCGSIKNKGVNDEDKEPCLCRRDGESNGMVGRK